MRVLVTGGAGYIGSHTVVELLTAHNDVVVVDDFSNSTPAALSAAERLGGGHVDQVRGDYGDPDVLKRVFEDGRGAIDAVIHFAGRKAVGESVDKPLSYYRTNVAGTLALLEAMQQYGVRNLVFSSSCTVYGEPERVPLTEDCRLAPMSPYGRTKLIIEQMIADAAASEPGWRALLLRYFNPVGAHPSGELGEDPEGVPDNLMPFVMQTAVGRHPEVRVFGNDYPTPDGTCIRDYIHVVDLALGHLAALDYLPAAEGCTPFNLGTGTGSSVLEVIAACEAAVGQPIPRTIAERRPGDVVAAYADPSNAQRHLGWKATRTLAEMCADAWRWQSSHPHGFR